MGTTLCALHLIGGDTAAIAKAYARLGWKEAAPAGSLTRSVAVVTADGGSTCLDNHCQQMDDGTLRALAADLSRQPGRVALVTSVHDSDRAEMIVYAGGAQVDALEHPDAPTDLTVLSPVERATLWSSLFGQRLGHLPDATPLDSSFAEDHLAAWIGAIGLPPEHTLLRHDDLAGQGPPALAEGATVMHLFLAHGAPDIPLSGLAPALAPYVDPDDSPHLPLYPGAWPLAPNTQTGLKWIILSGAGGFEGLSVSLDTSEVAGKVTLDGLRALAYPFHNGQITSPTSVADATLPLGTPLADGRSTYTLTPFALPDLDPQAKRRIAILLSLDITAGAGATARLALTVTPSGATPLLLPPMRLSAPEPQWHPRTANQPLSLTGQEALRALNTPSILSGVSILEEESDAIRDAMQAQVAAFVSALTLRDGATLTLRTLKHMTASGSITKKSVELAPDALAADKLWRRAFTAKSDMQSVAMDIRPHGAHLPMAGAILQMTLRDEAQAPDPAPHLSFWMANHAEAEAALGLDAGGFERLFADWADAAPLLQAHLIRAAWIPLFDLYTDYAHTPYESLSGVDWFRGGLNGTMMRRDWCTRTLRLIGHDMWLAPSLADRIPADALAPLTDTARHPRTGVLRMKSTAETPLAQLERALAPILPGAPA